MPKDASLGECYQGPGKRRDKECLIANGFSYVNNKWKNEVLYLRCTNYRLTKCPCRGKLVQGQIIQTSIDDHSCPDSSDTAQVRNLKHQMKVRSADLQLNLVDIYNDVLHNVPEEIASQIPYVEVQPSMAHVRRKRWPTNLHTVEDVIHYYETGGTAEYPIQQDYYQGYESYTDEGTLVM